MDHLSSCYFCGTTLDDTLRDYRVVPVELRDTDEVTTATLCQPCHGKLERLLAPVVAAAGAEGATLDVRTPPDRRENDGEGAADAVDQDDVTESVDADDSASETAEPDAEAGAEGDDPLLSDVESNLVEVDEDPLTGTADADPGDTLAGSEEEPDAGSDGHASGETDEEGEGDDKDVADQTSDRDERTVRIRHETDDTATDEGDETGTGDDPAPGAGDRAEGGESTDTAGDADTKGDATREGDAEAGGDDDDGGQSDTARTTVSALEYNKVMRLLQNRDFPVDRREFVTVAASAYGLAEQECAEVIDLAIDRGLVAERDGQLVRPD